MVHKFRSSSLKRMTAQARELATTVGAVMGCTRVNAEGVGCGRALEHAVHCPNFCTILCLKSIARVAMQLIIIKGNTNEVVSQQRMTRFTNQKDHWLMRR